jgi:hypothetical protein
MYSPSPVYIPDPFVVSSLNWASMGSPTVQATVSLASNAWPTANKAFFIPFTIGATRRYRNIFWMNGTAVKGNVDTGIYDATGAKLVSTGSIAAAGISSIQSVSIDITLSAGRYWLAMAEDTATSTGFISTTSILLPFAKTIGMRVLTTAMPLPASASSWVSVDTAFLPFIAITELTTV